MKYSHKLSDAVHILSYIEIYKDGDLSSKAIADSVESNPSLIRKLMSQLSHAGLLISSPGKVEPKLGRPADKITLLDIYHALDDDSQLLHVDPKTNPACIVGSNIQDTLNVAYDKIQQAAEDSMREVTLQSLIDDILVRENDKHLPN
ncbi:Rrf2 family transcriptional regulator [Lentilactobacillus kosonis]|uniref:Rrf2 family transcriptional regulator, group III n=1 Tax=Lentilactobacillus kosonis TaxID=2810561 RepID=A0A401FNS6_9LACO|nr:Rrf2 family transcriptional regulator [Lentilactobacillus kosonis]GAY74014.1 Rrf2 family transcriptional regulator, group III [Lentilactobacillus kosonis]